MNCRFLLCCGVFFLVLTTAAHATKVGINNTGCSFETIQAAIDAASSGDTLQVSGGTYNENLTITGKNLTITGDYDSTCTTHYPEDTYVNGGAVGRVLVVSSSQVRLENLILQNGSATNGAGLYLMNNSHATLNTVTIINNVASNHGGGAYVSPTSSLNLSHYAWIYHNAAGNAGGGVHLKGTLIGDGYSMRIFLNSAQVGGGVFNDSGNMFIGYKVESCSMSLESNTATSGDGFGGAIYATGKSKTTLTVDVEVYQNEAFYGGGIYADESTITLSGDHVGLSGNQVNYEGGGIYLTNNSQLNVTKSEIGSHSHRLANKATTHGGGIYSENSAINLRGAKISYNSASGSGGAIYLQNSTLGAKNIQIISNIADDYGGAVYANSSTVTIGIDRNSCNPEKNRCSRFQSNRANNSDSFYHGGALYDLNSNLTIDSTHFDGNSANRGGAIYSLGASSITDITNSLFYNNSGSLDGTALRNYEGSLNLKHSTLVNNSGGFAFAAGTSSTSNIFNTIISNNSGGGATGTLSIISCNIDQSINAGSPINPLFVDISGNDYHLQETSLAIDACNSAGVYKDLDYKHRPIGGKYDMGAYEYGTYSPWILFLPAIFGGANR